MHIRSLPDAACAPLDVPSALLDEAAMTLADTVVCALNGRRRSPVPEGVLTHPNGASVWGTTQRVAGADAVFLNALGGHIDDWDSVHYMTAGHPGVVLLPGLIAEFELGRINAADVLRGYVAGLEAMAVLGYAYGEPLRLRGLHPTAILGGFGAVLALCQARAEDTNVARTALSLVGTSVNGSAVAFGGSGKAFQVASAARSAFEAVHTATTTQYGPADRHWYTTLTERVESAELTSPHDYAQPWALTELRTYFKDLPVCAYFAQTLQALSVIARRHAPGTMSGATVDVPEYVLSASKYAEPRTPDEVRFSLPHLAGVMLHTGEITLADLTVGRIASEAAKARAKSIHLRLLPGHLERFGDELHGEITVHTSAGTHPYPLVYGATSPQNSWSHMERKARLCMSGDTAGASRFVRSLKAFEGMDPRSWQRLLENVAQVAHVPVGVR
ncbi:MmgE/PrpD family protein [Streptomyces sp. NBC_01288]|uniref:MmgE/PrpD family protein n=1 Tax=Streptomyces sp. NBC_01288 TaxID=2903814 RepID=UPI002E1159B4|nr:MmgE/PrpD family protein [Streptomyces sp. NBC_01288]